MLRFPVQGPVAATRERGREVRERLEDLLRSAAVGEVIEIDLTAVEAMTVSFADELIGRLMTARQAGEFEGQAVVIRGKGEDVRETVQAVLERRRSGALYRDQAAGAVKPLAGPPWFSETVAEAQRLRTFSALDLAKGLELSPQAANNRLKQLSASGAVIRERTVPAGGGKEYEYRAPSYT